MTRIRRRPATGGAASRIIRPALGPALAGAVLAVSLSVAACTTVPQPIPGLETPTAQAPAPEPPKPQPEQVSAVPIPDGQIDAAIGRLDELATGLMDSSKLPGLSVAVVHDGKTVYAKGFGVRSVNAKDQVDADTVFPLGSASQSLEATVIAAQVGSRAEGTGAGLRWDTPIHELMPSFAVADPYVTEHATVGDLLANRAGLPDVGALASTLGFDRQQLLALLPALPLTPFRASSEPSDIGLTTAAEAVAQSAGADWASLSQRLLYGPLGMSSTSSRSADYLAHGNRAAAHVLQDGAYAVAPATLQPDALSPADGVSSSAHDMARWMAMVLDGGSSGGRQVIAPEDLLPALSPQATLAPPATVDARSPSRGFGFDLSTSASGRVQVGSPSSSAAFAAIPSASVGIVVLANASDSAVPAALTAQFSDLVQFGALTQDWPALARAAATGSPTGQAPKPTGSLVGAKPPAQPAPAAALTSYDGVYSNGFFGPATVTTSNDSLILTLGPDSVKFPLRHWDGGTFTMTPPAGAAPPGSISRVVFSDGALQIEYLDGNGLGTFTRN